VPTFIFIRIFFNFFTLPPSYWDQKDWDSLKKTPSIFFMIFLFSSARTEIEKLDRGFLLIFLYLLIFEHTKSSFSSTFCLKMSFFRYPFIYFFYNIFL